MNLSATTPIKYSQGRLLQNDVKQKPTQDAATDDGCCTLHFCLGIVNTRVYNIADNLGNFGIFFTSQLAAYCASASVVLVPEHNSDSNSQSSGKQRSGSRMGKYRKVCPLGNHAV